MLNRFFTEYIARNRHVREKWVPLLDFTQSVRMTMVYREASEAIYIIDTGNEELALNFFYDCNDLRWYCVSNAKGSYSKVDLDYNNTANFLIEILRKEDYRWVSRRKLCLVIDRIQGKETPKP